VDLYQFHSGSREAFDSPELWSALAEQVEADARTAELHTVRDDHWLALAGA